MELHRLIFRVDFPAAFKLIPAWGDVLALLGASKHWNALGEAPEPRQIVAERKEQNRHDAITVQMTNVNGLLESHPITLDAYKSIFDDVNKVLEKADVTTFQRIGVRFFFLEPIEEFGWGRRALSDQISSDYWAAAKVNDELTDLSITSVHKKEEQFVRVNAGPIAKGEFPLWFGRPQSIKIESALLLDIDAFTNHHKFRTFDLRKVVEFSYDAARKRGENLIRYLKGVQ